MKILLETQNYKSYKSCKFYQNSHKNKYLCFERTGKKIVVASKSNWDKKIVEING